MPSRDLLHSIKVAPSIIGVTLATSATTSVQATATMVDTFGYESVTHVFRVHTNTLASGSISFYANDSADGTTIVQATGGPPPTAGVNALSQVIGGAWPAAVVQPAVGATPLGMLDCKRYVSGVWITTVSFSGIVSSDVILGHPHHRSAAV